MTVKEAEEKNKLQLGREQRRKKWRKMHISYYCCCRMAWDANRRFVLAFKSTYVLRKKRERWKIVWSRMNVRHDCKSTVNILIHCWNWVIWLRRNGNCHVWLMHDFDISPGNAHSRTRHELNIYEVHRQLTIKFVSWLRDNGNKVSILIINVSEATANFTHFKIILTQMHFLRLTFK